MARIALAPIPTTEGGITAISAKTVCVLKNMSPIPADYADDAYWRRGAT